MEGAVAEINGTKYGTLNDMIKAIEEITADGTTATVKLLKDIEVSGSYEFL